MAEPRIRILTGTGIVNFDITFSRRAKITLTGNVVFTFSGMTEGATAIVYIQQDATGGRTVGVLPPLGTQLVILGDQTDISTTASGRSIITVTLAQGAYEVTFAPQAP